MAYTDTFTLVAGGITITFNVRPSNIDYDRRAMRNKEPIPGALGQSVVQNMGYGGYTIKFKTSIWNITSITMTGAPAHSGLIMGQIDDWDALGTVLVFTTDYINFREGGSINVKITKLRMTENPGHNRDYTIELELTEFVSGSAI